MIMDNMRRPQGYLVLIWHQRGIREVCRNKVVNPGMIRLGQIISGEETVNVKLTKFGAGSGSTPVEYTDPSLETEIGKISGQVTGYPKTDGATQKNYFLVGPSELLGVWCEIGVFFGDDVLFARVNVQEREKVDEYVSGFYFSNMIA